MQQLATNEDIKIIEVNEAKVVSSREVAINFGKEHKHVIEKIENTIEEIRKTSVESSTHLFIESTYEDTYSR